MGGWGRGFLIGDGLVTLSGVTAGVVSILSSVPSFAGLTGGVGGCLRDREGSLDSVGGTSEGFSFAGFFGGRGLANLGFCVPTLDGLSVSA